MTPPSSVSTTLLIIVGIVVWLLLAVIVWLLCVAAAREDRRVRAADRTSEPERESGPLGRRRRAGH